MKYAFGALRPLLTLLILGLALSQCQRTNESSLSPEAKGPGSTEGDIVPGQYIVLFDAGHIAPAISYLGKATFDNRTEKAAAIEKYKNHVEDQINAWLFEHNIQPDQVMSRYTAIVAGVALKNVDTLTFERIKDSEAVKSVECNRLISLPQEEVEEIETSGGVSSRTQETSCAILNAGGSTNGDTSRYIWVMDSGVDLDHPDLNVNTYYSKGFVDNVTGDDNNGHGTHVAGIAAAKNNDIGVVGVSAGATIVAVKAFNAAGNTNSVILSNALQYIASRVASGDVVNMSFGSYYGANCATNSAYVAFLQFFSDSYVRVAMAAGNNSASADLYQPGCISLPRVVTVASMTCARTFSLDFSNYGKPPIDWIATGKNVKSTHLNGGYAVLSGTSMASPVVAGIMHARRAMPVNGGTVSYNGVNYAIAKR